VKTLLCFCCRCIDGYSRKILWLKCGHSNHHPGIIAGYYLESVTNVGGYPSRLRTDLGTENVSIAAIQAFVAGSQQAHIYGTSPGNQRIEAWWSFYRRLRSQWWIELFEALVNHGSFQPGHVRQTDLLRFCFLHLVQEDLDSLRWHWNTHRIRPSAGATCPPGVPDELYYLPREPARDRLRPANEPLPAEILEQVVQPNKCQDADFELYLHYLCDFYQWSLPCDTDAALQLYYQLLPHV